MQDSIYFVKFKYYRNRYSSILILYIEISQNLTIVLHTLYIQICVPKKSSFEFWVCFLLLIS